MLFNMFQLTCKNDIGPKAKYLARKFGGEFGGDTFKPVNLNRFSMCMYIIMAILYHTTSVKRAKLLASPPGSTFVSACMLLFIPASEKC